MSNLKMPGENCLILNCYSSRADPRFSFFRIPTKNDHKMKMEEQHCCSYYSCVDSDLKRENKNRTLHTSKLFLLTKTFQYTSNWSKASRAFTHPLIKYTQSRYNKFHYAVIDFIQSSNQLFYLVKLQYQIMVPKERTISLLPCDMTIYYIFTKL